jgi:hypothetical protein
MYFFKWDFPLSLFLLYENYVIQALWHIMAHDGTLGTLWYVMAHYDTLGTLRHTMAL